MECKCLNAKTLFLLLNVHNTTNHSKAVLSIQSENDKGRRTHALNEGVRVTAGEVASFRSDVDRYLHFVNTDRI